MVRTKIRKPIIDGINIMKKLCDYMESDFLELEKNCHAEGQTEEDENRLVR